MSSEDIQKDVGATKGRHYIQHVGGGISELTFSILSPQTVIADHTEVATGFENQGVGLRLLESLLGDARADGFKIVPLCPFVNAQRRKHPEWADLFNV